MSGPSGSHDDSYYRRLDVRRDASHDDIVRAYRRMAMGTHPDAHPEDPGAPGRFREITEAYEVLGDPERRADYDRHGTAVRVHVHDATPGDEAQIARHLGAPIVLGASRYTLRGDVPLLVGPVWVERNEEGSLRGSEASAWHLDDVWHRMLRSWWGHR